MRPGKAPCTWMVFGNDGAQWDRQKWFVDVSAATGCEYLLVDAGWRTERWGWLKDGGDLWARAAELCRYAAERNVGIVLWHAYPEGRDDGPGLTTVEAREELFRNCQKAGVKGVKIDFFNSESKAVIEAYEDLLRRAAKYQLMINFHGANKPTGEARTWPNEITREGIREQEYVLWDTLPLAHYGALPFTRMAGGPRRFPARLRAAAVSEEHHAHLPDGLRGGVQLAVPLLAGQPRGLPEQPAAAVRAHRAGHLGRNPRPARLGDRRHRDPGPAQRRRVVRGRAQLPPGTADARAGSDFAGQRRQELTVYRDGAAKTGVEIESGPRAPEARASSPRPCPPAAGSSLPLSAAPQVPGLEVTRVWFRRGRRLSRWLSRGRT